MVKKVVEKKPKKKVKSTSEKSGRNLDGTFAEGHEPYKNGGRPQDRFSHRAIAAQRAMKDPSRIKKDLKVLDDIMLSKLRQSYSVGLMFKKRKLRSKAICKPLRQTLHSIN